MAHSTPIIVFSLLSLSASGFSRWQGPPDPYQYLTPCQMEGNCPMPRNEELFHNPFQRSGPVFSPAPRTGNDFARSLIDFKPDFAFLDEFASGRPNIRENREIIEDYEMDIEPDFEAFDNMARPAPDFDFSEERSSQRFQNSKTWHLKQEPFCGRSIPGQQSRIVGGSKASFGQFPWQAQIWAIKSPDSEPTYTCGGTLVTNEVIVTAGHCIHYNDPERYIIKLGRQYVDEDDEFCLGYEQRYKVIDLIVHPDFNKRHLTNDVAVMWIRSEKYNQTVHYCDHIVPACLPELSRSQDEFYEDGLYGVVSGWGLLNETDKTGSNSLQHVALPILRSDVCLGAYGKFVEMDENKQFCAGNDRGQDACAGDSGGPFVVNRNGHHYLVGVVSYGRGCARPEYPGVYSKVYHYLPWINQVVGEKKQTETEITTNEISANSVKIPSKRPPPTTTPQPPPSIDVVEKSTEIFCPSQYSLLRCSGDSTITVTRAVFALDTLGHCGQRQRSNRSSDGDCSLENAEAVPRHVCNGKRTCWVYHNIFHDDPCPGLAKFAQIHYECE